MTVIGTGGTERGRELVAVQGAHHVLDHRSPVYLDELMKLTGGRGVDVILEMLANVNLAKDLTVLAHKGRVVVIGNRGNIEINPREIMRRDAAVLGLVLWNATRPELATIHAGIVAGLENGSLRPVVGNELPLAEGGSGPPRHSGTRRIRKDRARGVAPRGVARASRPRAARAGCPRSSGRDARATSGLPHAL